MISRILIGLGLLAGGLCLNGCRPEAASVPSTAELGASSQPANDVAVTIDFGGRAENKSLTAQVPTDATVLDALLDLQRRQLLQVEYRGRGAQAFLISIDGVANGGGRDDNWVFRINGKLGNASCGVVTLPDGATLNWTRGRYQPE